MMLDNPSLLLARSFAPDAANALAGHRRILLVNPLSDQYALQLASDFEHQQFTAFGYNSAVHQLLLAGKKPDQGNFNSLCAAQLTAADHSGKFDCVVIYFPKSKPEFSFVINNLFNHVEPGAPVYLVGDNKGGIKSCDKLLQPFCDQAVKIDAAKHCSLYRTVLTRASDPFVLEQWYRHYPVKINQIELDVYSLPGVFSFGALDDGTRLLLENIPPGTAAHDNTDILDFGCGAGLIGAFVAKSAKNDDIRVCGLDVHALAVASTQKTYRHNQINGTTLLSDGLSQLSGKFNQVYSNPPFHSGVKTNYAITELFLNTIGGYIYPGGSLTIVANNFLKYQSLLHTHFRHSDTIAANKRFNVYHARV